MQQDINKYYYQTLTKTMGEIFIFTRV